jgi:alpha-beta hydrolase superfamily lysophospholipase
VKQRELRLPGCQDAALLGQAWLPERDLRSVIVISHGLAEHGGRYAGLAARLVDRGHAVYAIDHRGHGRSSGPRANIDRFSYLVSDLSAFVGRAQREHPNLPVFLLGHSMGGAVAFASALRIHATLRGLVLSAPALAVGQAVSPVRAGLLRIVSRFRPGAGALTLPATAVSRDPAVVRAYESDPLVHRGPIPARTVAELLDAMARFPAAAPTLKVPVLVQHGTADSLVPLVATRPVYETMGSPKQRWLRYYEGLYHEVYNEPERDTVIGDLERWLDGQL